MLIDVKAMQNVNLSEVNLKEMSMNRLIYNILRDKYNKYTNNIRSVTVQLPQLTLKSVYTMLNNTQKLWKTADAVCFDVDSTVIQEEGIDELAKFCNKGSQVAELTNKAMTGTMTFRESLSLRLDIIRPSLTQMRDFIRMCPPPLTPGIKKLIELLHNKGVEVYLVSGGFRSIIVPIAHQLNIPQENIYANRLKFYFNGEYAGFDENEPTSASGGKPEVIRRIKQLKGHKCVVMIGDGATDLEACPPADAFIGYGGNVIREQVKSKAEWYVTDFNELIQVLQS